MTKDEIREQVIAYIAKTIHDFLSDDMTDAEAALSDIAQMIEVRGLHIFENMPRLPPP